MKPYNILFVQHDGGTSGSTISLRNLVLALNRTIYSPRVALFSDGPAKELFEKLGIPVDIVPGRPFWTCPGPDWKELGYYINFLALLPNKAWSEYLEVTRPDVLHINDKACLQVGISARGTNIPIVWHLRSTYYPSRSKLHARISKSLIRKYATKLIAISEDEVDKFEDLPNLHIINNSVDIEQAEEAQEKRNLIRTEFKIARDEIAIATVTSTMNEVRGTWDFIHAAGIVNKKLLNHRVKFFIVARIQPKEEINLVRRRMIKKPYIHPLDKVNLLKREYDLEDKLALTGYRSDPLSVMAGMDIIVLTNRYGAFSRMTFESMSVGTPVVVTAGHSGKSRVAMDGENAIIVEPANPESIAEGMIRLIQNEQLRQRLSEQGKIHVRQHFDPQKNARLVEDVYKELLISQGH